MESGQMWFLGLMGLAIISLSQALVLVLRLSQRRNSKKSVVSDDGNPGHGERIATLEEAVDNQEKNNERDHRLIREDIRKLGGRIDRIKK